MRPIFVSASGCHEYSGQKDKDGYGVWCGTRVHRIVWEKEFGAIPDGMWVLHKCDNPSCCNPNHLFLGTVLDNNRDMKNKGRGPYGGIKNPSCRLTEKEVRSIATDARPSRQVGAEFGISHRQVLNIRNGKQWKHLAN